MYNCDKCSKVFKNNQQFKQHLNRKIPCNRIIECDICKIHFKTLFLLKQHKNRKIKKCYPPDITYELNKLKEEIKELKNKPNITNITNNINNNITNNTINVFTPEGKLYHTYFLKSNPLQQLEFEKAVLSKLSLEDYTDELSNIYNFTNMVKEVCFNMALPANWIICKDDLFNDLKLKIDNSNIVSCMDNILYLIYTIANQVIKYNDLDNDLIDFYNTFIEKYDNGEYKENENVKQFIKLCNEELFKHFSKILNIISDRKNNVKQIEITINNLGDEDITFIKKNILYTELLNVIEKKYSKDFYSNKFKVNEYKYTGIMDLKMIDIFTYFLKLIYNNENYICNQTIKYKEDKFYIYKNNDWNEIKINELINQIFSKIHIILKIYKINLPENMHSENYIESLYKERYNDYCKIGDNKYYKKILKEYYINDKSFDDHELNIIS